MITVTPEVDGIPSLSKPILGSGLTIDYIIGVIDVNDDVEAGGILHNESPITAKVFDGSIANYPISGAYLVRVSVIAVCSAGTSGKGSKVAADTEATVITNLYSFVFNTSDSVTSFNLGLTGSTITCEGYAE